MLKYLKELGKNISDHRQKAGFETQTKFANAMEVKQATVSAWESGKIDIPYSTLVEIAGKCNTSPAALCDPSIPLAPSPDSARLEAIRLIFSADGDDLDSVLRILRGPAAIPSKNNKPSAG